MSIFLNNVKRDPSLIREGNSLNKNINKSLFLHELEINGKNVDDDDNFTMKDDEEQNKAANGEETPEDAADNAATPEDNPTPVEDNGNEDDFTLSDNEDTSTEENDDQPTEEAPAENNDDDFTLSDDDTEDTPTGDETPTEDNPDNGGEEQPAPETTPEEGGDNNTDDDFTLDDNAGGGDTGGTEGGEAGGDAPAEGGDDTTGDANNTPDSGDGKGNTSSEDPDVKASEEEIYNTLTDNEKRIRTLQLKVDYKNFYDTINHTMIGINGIPKNNDNIIAINKLANSLIKTKYILIDYIENNFDKSSYMENYANYIKFIAIFRTIANVLSQLSNNSK